MQHLACLMGALRSFHLGPNFESDRLISRNVTYVSLSFGRSQKYLIFMSWIKRGSLWNSPEDMRPVRDRFEPFSSPRGHTRCKPSETPIWGRTLWTTQ
ncbi:hypothetical protein BDV12DRAFT_166218 [Aspergillus spectabilis]